jgi:hypothetical protein
MRILFLHPDFPAQFRHLAKTLAKNPEHQVVFGTMRQQGSMTGIYKVIYKPSREVHPTTHQYIRNLESAVGAKLSKSRNKGSGKVAQR